MHAVVVWTSVTVPMSVALAMYLVPWVSNLHHLMVLAMGIVTMVEVHSTTVCVVTLSLV